MKFECNTISLVRQKTLIGKRGSTLDIRGNKTKVHFNYLLDALYLLTIYVRLYVLYWNTYAVSVFVFFIDISPNPSSRGGFGVNQKFPQMFKSFFCSKKRFQCDNLRFHVVYHLCSFGFQMMTMQYQCFGFCVKLQYSLQFFVLYSR